MKKENKKETDIYLGDKVKPKWELTSLLVILAGILMFFFLVLGSLTENRFGTHIVWAADLSASPMWYSLFIIFTSALIVVAGLVLFAFSYNGKLQLDDNRLRTIRIGSWALVGASVFFVALSSITFATFNNDFFKNTMDQAWVSTSPVYMIGLKSKDFLNPILDGTVDINDADAVNNFINGLNVNDIIGTVIKPSMHAAKQAVIIAGLSIIAIVGIVISTAVLSVVNMSFSDTTYFTSRNAVVMLIAVGWVVFNINLFAFGALGGDAGVLIESLTNGVVNQDLLHKLDNVKWDDLTTDLNALGAISDPGEAFAFLIDNIVIKDLGVVLPNDMTGEDIWGLALPLFTNLHKWWTNLWSNGVIGGLKVVGKGWIIPEDTSITLPLSLQLIIGDVAMGMEKVPLAQIFHWTGGLYKPGFMEGVNQSISAMMIEGILVSSLLWIPAIAVLEHFNMDSTRRSISWKASTWTIMGVSILYFLILWTAPYINIWDGPEPFNPILNGLINGDLNGIAPGLVGQAGEPGGISGAIVYFSPNYHGTITWKICLLLTIIIPITSIITATVLQFTGKEKAEK